MSSTSARVKTDVGLSAPSGTGAGLFVLRVWRRKLYVLPVPNPPLSGFTGISSSRERGVVDRVTTSVSKSTGTPMEPVIRDFCPSTSAVMGPDGVHPAARFGDRLLPGQEARRRSWKLVPSWSSSRRRRSLAGSGAGVRHPHCPGSGTCLVCSVARGGRDHVPAADRR
jgi:hypothetical protein